MFIITATGQRGPAYPEHTPYTAPDGTRHAQYPRELLTVIADPTPPADYTEATYFRTEQDEAPYVVYTRKPQEMIDAALAATAREDARRLLKDTDWYVTRLTETGVHIPVEIVKKRVEARTLLSSQ